MCFPQFSLRCFVAFFDLQQIHSFFFPFQCTHGVRAVLIYVPSFRSFHSSCRLTLPRTKRVQFFGLAGTELHIVTPLNTVYCSSASSVLCGMPPPLSHTHAYALSLSLSDALISKAQPIFKPPFFSSHCAVACCLGIRIRSYSLLPLYPSQVFTRFSISVSVPVFIFVSHKQQHTAQSSTFVSSQAI